MRGPQTIASIRERLTVPEAMGTGFSYTPWGDLPAIWAITTPADADRAVDLWLTSLDRVAWAGRSGATRRTVAETLGLFARQRGGPRFAASIDEISVEAGVHYVTARRALQGLCNDDWLTVDEKPTARHATIWLLQPTRLDRDAPTQGLAHTASIRDDWGRWTALGRQSVIVWRAVGDGSTASQTAEILAMSVGAVRTHLRKLEQCGAVQRVGRHWQANPDAAEALSAWYGHIQPRQRQHLAARKASRRYSKRTRPGPVAELGNTRREPPPSGPELVGGVAVGGIGTATTVGNIPPQGNPK